MRRGLRQLPHVRIHDSGNEIVPIIPILTGSVGRTLVTAKALLDGGVYVNPVLPPAVPQESCLLRSSYTATHTDAQLQEALGIIGGVFAALSRETDIDHNFEI
jgi:7-keto-8-aminopelargonate synthetase-like enzyme